MTNLEAKTQFYQIQGFKPVWSEYVTKLAEIEDLAEWSKTVEPLPTLPPLKFEKRKRNYISLILP